MIKESFMRMIPSLDGFYVIYSTATRCPYVMCNPETYDDEILVFLKEDEADDLVSAMRADEIPVGKSRVEKNGMLSFFNEIYGYGINAVRFIEDREGICVQLASFVKKGDLSKVPEERRPLENPTLQLSMLYFSQEVRCKKRDMKKVAAYEEEMVANIRKSTFIVPVREVEALEGSGKKTINFMVIKSSDNQPVVPVFTDTMTLSQFLGDGKCMVFKMTLDQLANLQIPGVEKGYLFNPNGVGLLLNKKQIAKIIEDF